MTVYKPLKITLLKNHIRNKQTNNSQWDGSEGRGTLALSDDWCCPLMHTPQHTPLGEESASPHQV